MSSKKIGILGGGQLARMLAGQAKALNVKVYVLSGSKKDPAARVTSYWQKGDVKSLVSLSSFIKKIDILTFESEFVLADKIKKAIKKTGKRISISPSLKLLSLIQDRWTQKNLLETHKIKTAPFLKVQFVKNNPLKNRTLLKEVYKKLNGPFVLKKRIGGYDGYGTFIIKNQNDITKFKEFSDSFIAETFIPFKRELALQSVRNKRGDIVFLPLVETKQQDSRCLWVKGPVSHSKLPLIKKKITAFLKSIRYEGVLAFEFFDTGKELLVNELAPRVHNSAHYSLDGLSEDQFTLHLKACLNLKLKSPRKKEKGFAMMNLLGEASKHPKWTLSDDVSFYWYEKDVSRKGRKMGHINAVGSSSKEAFHKVAKARKKFKSI